MGTLRFFDNPREETSMLARLMTAAALFCTCAALPAAADDPIVSGAEAEAILDVAQGYGAATIASQDNGDPRLDGFAGGLPYHIFFMNCAAGTGCEDLNFFAGFSDTKPTLDAINAWNRDKPRRPGCATPACCQSQPCSASGMPRRPAPRTPC
jgi:hypothetical protein